MFPSRPTAAIFGHARQLLRTRPDRRYYNRTMIKSFTVLFAFVASSLAAEIIDVTIGVQPPLFSPSGGIVDRVVAKSLEASGRQVRFNWLPVGRMLALLEKDGLDVYVTPSNTPGQGNPHVALLEARGVFFYKKARFPLLKVTRLEDLAGKLVATVTNSPLKASFEKAGILVDEGPIETMFKKLETGRVDFASTADVGGLLNIRKEFPGREGEFAFTDFAYGNIQVGFYVKNRPALLPFIAALKEGFARIKADGTLERMLVEHFGPENWRRVKIMD